MKPPVAVRVIVEVPCVLASVVTLVGLALILKPGGGPAPTTWTDIVAVELVIRLFVPPVPVIATV